MADVKIVSKVPPITPELLAKNEEEQQALRDQFQYVAPLRRTYADTVIRGLLDDISYYRFHILTTKNPEMRELLQVRHDTARRDCAQWLMSIGNFKLAEELAMDEHTKRQCRERMGES